jgi:hypothetical protein
MPLYTNPGILTQYFQFRQYNGHIRKGLFAKQH